MWIVRQCLGFGFMLSVFVLCDFLTFLFFVMYFFFKLIKLSNAIVSQSQRLFSSIHSFTLFSSYKPTTRSTFKQHHHNALHRPYPHIDI